MKTRSLTSTMLALAVLFSQAGGTVLAAICPHLRSANNSCHTMAEAAGEHHAMNDTPAEVSSESWKSEAVETQDSNPLCSYCVVHSRNKRDESLLQRPNVAQGVNDLTTPIALLTPAPALTQTATRIAKAHGPPGNNAPLHLLINIFRI